MVDTDKKGAGQAGAGRPDDKKAGKAAADRGADPGRAKPSGDSPKPHGDPLLHVVKDK
jgi:hypothetical protein